MPRPFRIEKPSLIATVGVDGGKAADTFDNYMSRLITLIPAEALAAYLTIKGFFPETTTAPGESQQLIWFRYLLPILGLALVLVSRTWGTKDPSVGADQPQWRGTFIAALAFVLWTLAMGDRPLGIELDTRIASAIIVIFSFAVPRFYKGE